MTRKTLLGFQVKGLLSNLSDHGAQHLTEIQSDLAQTNFLLGEAIEKLGASFMAIHEAVVAQQQAVEMLLSGAKPAHEVSENLKDQHAEIARHVNAAVTGLQFQDMTNQLIGRTLQRVNGLRDVLATIGNGSAGMPTQGDVGAVVAALSDMNKQLEEQSATLERTLWKAVCQTHMESGDIELF